MKLRLIARQSATVLTALLLTASLPFATRAADSTVDDELKYIVNRVGEKIHAGKVTEASLAPELKAFDDLLAKHKGEKTEDVAQVLYMKAELYSQVLDDETKAGKLEDQLIRDFPDTKFAANLKQQAASRKIREGLAVGKPFPDFQVKDLAGKPLSIAGFKGKVVLVDFWATWCGPCVRELPNVIEAYKNHHAEGLEIVGISLDQDQQKLQSFLKQKGITWAQYFDGQGWQNMLAQKYGVNSIPATYLLDREGKIIAKDIRGEALEKAITAALAK